MRACCYREKRPRARGQEDLAAVRETRHNHPLYMQCGPAQRFRAGRGRYYSFASHRPARCGIGRRSGRRLGRGGAGSAVTYWGNCTRAPHRAAVSHRLAVGCRIALVPSLWVAMASSLPVALLPLALGFPERLQLLLLLMMLLFICSWRFNACLYMLLLWVYGGR